MARRSQDPVRRPTVGVQLLAVDADGGSRRRPDKLATEEPMEIRLHGPGEEPRPVAITLRTPGHDFELALGFLYAERLVRSAHDLANIAYCLGAEGEQEYNVVTVRVRTAVGDALRPRAFVANSSCGLCGKTTLDELEKHCASLVGVPFAVSADVIRSLSDRLSEGQTLFDATGGLHAAALVRSDGEVLVVREDVGRHNAVDKLVGHALIERHVPIEDSMLVVSGRLGFELVQKAALAGITTLCAVGAPSSMAIEAAQRFGQTVVAFMRDERFNIYTHPERVSIT